MVLGIVVLALLLFNLGIQLYGLVAGPAWASYGRMVGPMMGGRAAIHPVGGFGGGFGFLGQILGIALIGLIVAGIAALVRVRGVSAKPTDSPESIDAPTGKPK
jgi:hypothetical protein